MKETSEMAAGIKTQILAVDRVIHDLLLGVPALISDGREHLLVLAAEAALPESLAQCASWSGQAPQLIITAKRAEKLKLSDTGQPIAITLDATVTPDAIMGLIDPALRVTEQQSSASQPATKLQDAALQLAKYGSLLPAVVCFVLPSQTNMKAWAEAQGLLIASDAAIRAYQPELTQRMVPESEARVPLTEAQDTKIIAFRPRFGVVQHLAIIVGDPKQVAAPLVRIHSSCLTGDILGSLRCDCGPQLQMSLRQMAQAGQGVLLYLSQEGRGIGIINKLRAYALQDGGLDTIDANEELGFEADERDFQPAAEILKQLGIASVTLLTNNPAKIEEMKRYGINVTDRKPLIIPASEHNKTYLDTKARRCGHLI